jgi:hypothetical protein
MDLSTQPSVLRDRDELLERGLELLVGRAVDPYPQHLEDLALGPAVDENDEAEAVPGFLLCIEAGELRDHVRLVVRSLLRRGARRELRRTDRRMGVEDCSLVLRRELVDERPRTHERVGLVRETLDEARTPLEQLGELVDAQLPR